MTRQEAYRLLNIPENSNAEQIKQAYKKQAKKYHPDLYQGDKKFAEDKMKQINEAYELLCKPHTSTTNTSSNSGTSYDYSSKEEAQRRAEAQRKYEEEMQKIREEAERIQKELEEQIKLREKFLKLSKPILIILFFALEFYLVKILILAINSIQLSFSEANWFFFAFWILLGILAVIFNVGVPAGLIWLFKKAKIFKRKK